MKNLFFIIALGALILLPATSAFAGKNTPKAYDNVRQLKGKNYCVYDEDKGWIPARQVTRDDQTLYKAERKPKKYAKNKAAKTKKFKKRRKQCKQQQDPNTASLDKLPGNEEIISERSSTSAVSGTPPSYPSITNESALSLYWREVDSANVPTALAAGSPTAGQCGEFFSGTADGQSGGLVACEANINAIRALVKPLEAGIAACYLRKMATKENALGGGISLVKGSKYPGGIVENLYAIPNGSKDRTIKMNIQNDEREQTIFVKVYSKDTLAANENSYQVDLWFCDPDSDTPSGLDQIAVGTDNSFSATSKGLRDGAISIATTGQLLKDDDGNFEFDPTAEARGIINVVFEEFGTKDGFDVTIQDGLITMKTHEINGTTARKSMALLSYLGGISDLAMTDGAARFQTLTNDVQTGSGTAAFEYRDTTYAAAVTGDKLTTVQAADFSTDSFFTTEPSVELSVTGYTCSDKADVEINLDMASSTMQAIDQECNSFVPQNTNFCSSDTLTTAEENFFNECTS